MAFPYYDAVQRAYAELQAEGFIRELPPGHQEEIEAQKGILTRRAGYYANLQNANIGLLEKTSGNQSEGFSVDILLNRMTGQFYDIASDNGRIAIPIDGGPSAGTDLIDRWRQPTRALAGIGDTPVPVPEPEPPPVPPDHSDEKLDAIFNLLVAVQSKVDLIEARQNTTDAGVIDLKRAVADVRTKLDHPLNYTNRFIGAITPVGVPQA